MTRPFGRSAARSSIDPLSVRTHALGTSLLLFTRRYDDAIALARKGLEIEPDAAFTLAFLGIAVRGEGRLRRRHGHAAASRTARRQPHHPRPSGARAGRCRPHEGGARVLRTIEEAAQRRYFCPYEIATVYVSLGDNDTATRLFRKGTDERADCMAWLGVEPWIDRYRADPRYRTLLRDVGLAPNVH